VPVRRATDESTETPGESPSPPLSAQVSTPRLVLRPPRPGDVPAIRHLLRRNAQHLKPWSPLQNVGEDPTSLTEISKSIARHRREWTRGEAFVLFVVLREGSIIGRIRFGGVARGAFSSAYLGYWIDVDHQSQGYMTEALRAAVSFAFRRVRLHRIQAAVMPRNAPSLRVLGKVGFRKEGEALRYLQIAGRWEDHHIFAVTVEEWATVDSDDR
jgi:[ribosomal protein S5]-alanine N-acetyltransferase